MTALLKRHLLASDDDVLIQVEMKAAIKAKLEAQFSDSEQRKFNLMATYPGLEINFFSHLPSGQVVLILWLPLLSFSCPYKFDTFPKMFS